MVKITLKSSNKKSPCPKQQKRKSSIPYPDDDYNPLWMKDAAGNVGSLKLHSANA